VKAERILREHRILRAINPGGTAQSIIRQVVDHNRANGTTSSDLARLIDQRLATLQTQAQLDPIQARAFGLLTLSGPRDTARFLRAHKIHHIEIFIDSKPPPVLANKVEAQIAGLLREYRLDMLATPSEIVTLYLSRHLHHPTLEHFLDPEGHINWQNINNSLFKAKPASALSPNHPLLEVIFAIYYALAIKKVF
jgi:hypothetical protein